jgi:hypothetical protein
MLTPSDPTEIILSPPWQRNSMFFRSEKRFSGERMTSTPLLVTSSVKSWFPLEIKYAFAHDSMKMSAKHA